MTLPPGRAAVFGYRRRSERLTVTGDGAQISVVAGRVASESDHWTLSNFSAVDPYVVENLNDRSEYVKVRPGRRAAPILFELARVVLPGNHRPEGFHVLAPPPRMVDPVDMLPPSAASFASLDEQRKYFAVLVALCEPRLRGGLPVGAPTASEIVERLRPLPDFRDLTRDAVNYHISYLARGKLRPYLDQDSASGRVRWKREALASVALRYEMVREGHLSLLPDPPSGRGEPSANSSSRPERSSSTPHEGEGAVQPV
ncbi:hypothetical protein [Salinispora pacifica]|uniref:hypothetical protein n=1 Tax=Salinispora pacifica TaxID=351187 RepID=UPI0004AC93EB|nr:hypothetical protein [Salinispora pacifica]